VTDACDATLTPARLAVVAYARSIVGLTAPDDAYLALVAPGDAAGRQKKVADESDCMLVCLGIQEAVFVVPARAPYIDGSAPSLLEKRAGGYPWAPAGALRLATHEAPPRPGDAVWWGKGPGGPEHVETVVASDVGSVVDSAQMPSTMLVTMIAGGERMKDGPLVGHETVATVERTLEWDGHGWVDPVTKRRVLCVLDADLMEQRFGLRGAAA
jgi:hypothetical protein